MPILLVFGAIVVLAVAAYFYERKWGIDGPFPTQHQHGGGEPEGSQEGHKPDDGHDHAH